MSIVLVLWPLLSIVSQANADWGSLQPGLPTPAGRADDSDQYLRDDNVRLREENAELKSEEQFLLQRSATALRGGGFLSAEAAALRAEDARLRRRVTSLATALAGARRGADAGQTGEVGLAAVAGGFGRGTARAAARQRTLLLLIGLGGVFLLLVACLAQGNHLFQSPEDSDSEDESDVDDKAENRLKQLVKGKELRRCPVCWCCCSSTARWFIVCVLVFTALGGAVLWETGVLQPIIAQCILYVYITMIVSGFVSLMVSQLWNLVRTLVSYTINEFRKVKSHFKFFGKKSRHTLHDFLDDGKLNQSYTPPSGRTGARRRTPPLARPEDKRGPETCVVS